MSTIFPILQLTEAKRDKQTDQFAIGHISVVAYLRSLRPASTKGNGIPGLVVKPKLGILF